MPRGSSEAQVKSASDGSPLPEIDPAAETSTVYTMTEAAALKGVSYHTVSRAVRRDTLPARRLGRMALIAAEDLRAWRPMRERAPHKYRRRTPDPDASPAVVDLSLKDRVSLALELATIYQLSRAAAAGLPLPDFMALVADRFASALDLKRVVIWAVDLDRREGRRLAGFGPPISDAPDTAPLDNLPLVRRGLDLTRATVLPGPAGDPARGNWTIIHLDTVLVTPLRVGDNVRGVLVADRAGEPFDLSADQLALARVLAAQAALALDRARLLEAERARADQLGAIIENVGEAVFASDPAGRMSIINAAGRALLGMDDAVVPAAAETLDVVKMAQRYALGGDPIPPEEAPLMRAVRGEVVRDQQYLIVANDGTRKSVSVSAQPIRGGQGEPHGAVAVVRDITDAQATAERQANRVTRLEVAAAQSGAVATIALAVNASSHIGQVARSAIAQMTTLLAGTRGVIYFREADGGLVRQAAMPASPSAEREVISPEMFPTILVAFSQRQAIYYTYDAASAAERRSFDRLAATALLIVPLVVGEEIIGAALINYPAERGQPAEDELQLAAALAGQCAVAIQKARLLERIESAHQRLLAVVDHLPLGVIIVEAPSGRLILANQAAAELVGGPVPEVVVGSLDLAAADGSALPPDGDPLALTLGSGVGRFGETFILRRLDGTAVTVLANHVPVRDALERVTGVVAVLQDVAGLRALDRAKDEFLSVAAHELRNPLTSLHGNLQLLRRRWRDDPTRADDDERMATILAQSDRLARLVGRLLDVSRAELGRLDLELAESDAATVVRRTVDDASGLSTAHQVTADAPPRVPVIWDEVRIEQVLANLLGNAIKHTPGGEIRITLATTADDRLRIEVRDSGPGIPEALLANLFDRYVRGRPGANGGQPEASGLGLGLYISRLIARAHGGDLSVANAERGGARFLLTLPRAARPPRAGLAPAAGLVA